MRWHPTLRTGRLVLREFSVEDVPEICRLAGAWEVARTMLNIPHPYEERMAEDWISSYRPAFEARERVTFVVVLSGDGTLLGSVTLGLNARDGNG